MAAITTPEEINLASNKDTLLSLTTKIVSAYVSHNIVSTDDLPALMEMVHKNLMCLDSGSGAPLARPEPAVKVENSITPDYIICLEDGKKLKMLKRHLKTSYNLTPDQYRERWNLPTDYPMVAPNYAKQRSRLAKEIGLGTARSNQSKAA